MNQSIGQISIVVKDYDQALDFYLNVLKFQLLEDTKINDKKRWVRIKPQGDGGCSLLLAKAKDEAQNKVIGNQTGGRVFLFLYTDDIQRDRENLLKHNVKIVRDLSKENFGSVLVFADIYGNLWDLIQKI